MPYPLDLPVSKHDITFVHGMPPPERPFMSSKWAFASTSELFRAVSEHVVTGKPIKLAAVYSYKDAPDHPGPLSRELVILGVADTSVSVVRKLDSHLPDCLHRCTIAVKLADSRHMPRLPPNHQQNSKAFGRLMQRMRKEGCVAIFAKDKHNRFGILKPMPIDENKHDVESGRDLLPEDCAADCFVGNIDEVIAYLTGANAESTARTDDEETFEPTTPPYAPPPDSDSNIDDSLPVYVPDDDVANNNNSSVWQATTSADESGGDGIWKAPGQEDDHQDGGNGSAGFSAPWESTGASADDSAAPWSAAANPVSDAWTVQQSESDENGNKRSFEEMNGGDSGIVGENADNGGPNNENNFHANAGAAAADTFYSNLKRDKGTRSDSWIYHMRAFNGWVKAMQIQELDPRIVKNGRPQGRSKLRVLDLACGKGGDLLKWAKHKRGMQHYVGIDVARGSLRDAAVRARGMRLKNQLNQAIFTCADLGDDVPGRKKSPNHKHMQKLLTWSLNDEDPYESGTPEFKPIRGGGVSETDRFDVVSIQFAIHYMMSTGKRARRFLHTVSQLLEVGGNLICTTIDARVVMKHLLALGINYHIEDYEKEGRDMPKAEISVGSGSCLLRFDSDTVKRIFTATADGGKGEEELFGLQYSFMLKDGDDNAAGVGEAVDLPEWLTPLPVLKSIAKEAGLELDYAQNFHEFWDQRKDPSLYAEAHNALQNMRVLNRQGSISDDEWSVSRLYVAISFRKVRESTISISDDPADDSDDDNDDGDGNAEEEEARPAPPPVTAVVELDPIKSKKMLPMAMMAAKKSAGDGVWASLSGGEKKRRIQLELQRLAAK